MAFKAENERKPRDLACCGLFILFNIGMLVLAIYAGAEGDYKRIINGIDYRGCTCDTTSCADPSGSTDLGRLSVFVDMYNTSMFGDSLALVCAPSCPVGAAADGGVQVVCYPETGALIYAVGSSQATQLNWLRTTAGKSDDYITTYCGVTYTASSMFGYCVPSSNSTFIDAVDDVTGDISWTNAFDSIEKGWVIILASLLVAVVLGFVYLFIISHEGCVKPVTYIAMVLVLVCLVVGGWALWQRADDIKDNYAGDNSDGYKDDNNYRLSFAGAILTWAIAALYLCFIVFMFKRIKLALECIVDAAEALRSTPLIIFLPISFIILGLGIFAAWLVTAVNLFSVGDVESYDPDGPDGTAPGGVLKRISIDDQLRNMIIYHLFGLIWIVEFLSAVVMITIAIVVTRWFFAPEVRGEKSGLPSWPTMTALKTTLRNHLGSAAFGSIIIAIVSAFRWILEYIDRKTKKATQVSRVFRFVMCCCKCCLWCLEKCLRYLNKQAYIQIAITGESFWTSACAAFELLVSNVLRFGALSVVGTVFLFIGKLFVAGGSTLIAYLALTKVDRYADESKDTAVANPFIVCVVVFLGAYLVASLFMSLMEVAMDAALQSAILGKAGPNISAQMTENNTKIQEAGVQTYYHHASPHKMTGPGPSTQPRGPQAGSTIKY